VPAFRRIYSCRHDFFDTIDGEEKAYWFGFIAADGCVHENRLRISLSAKDADHLRRIRAAMESTRPVRVGPPPKSAYPNSPGVATLAIRSDRLIGGLARAGVGPRKSLTLRWPEDLPEGLIRHFLRGYVDGDGCWSVRPDSYVRKDGTRGVSLYWCVEGTEHFLKGAQRYLMGAAGLRETKLYPHRTCNGMFRLAYCGRRQVGRIHRVLYEGATVWLPRKRGIVEPYLSKERAYLDYSHSS
jgi:hypothetical protein